MAEHPDDEHPVQRTINAMNKISQQTRGNYHLTLGGLISCLQGMRGDWFITFDNGPSPGMIHSYRGYYEDLAIEPSEKKITVEEFLKAAKIALGQTFEGYKGGDYLATDRTPLWCSEYGRADGRAIMNAVSANGRALLYTRQID